MVVEALADYFQSGYEALGFSTSSRKEKMNRLRRHAQRRSELVNNLETIGGVVDVIDDIQTITGQRLLPTGIIKKARAARRMVRRKRSKRKYNRRYSKKKKYKKLNISSSYKPEGDSNFSKSRSANKKVRSRKISKSIAQRVKYLEKALKKTIPAVSKYISLQRYPFKLIDDTPNRKVVYEILLTTPSNLEVLAQDIDGLDLTAKNTRCLYKNLLYTHHLKNASNYPVTIRYAVFHCNQDGTGSFINNLSVCGVDVGFTALTEAAAATSSDVQANLPARAPLTSAQANMIYPTFTMKRLHEGWKKVSKVVSRTLGAGDTMMIKYRRNELVYRPGERDRNLNVDALKGVNASLVIEAQGCIVHSAQANDFKAVGTAPHAIDMIQEISFTLLYQDGLGQTKYTATEDLQGTKLNEVDAIADMRAMTKEVNDVVYDRGN